MRAGPMGISLTGFLVVEVVEARRHALLLDGTARLGDGLALGLFSGRTIDNAGKGIIGRGIGGCRDGTGASGLAGGPAGNRCTGSDLGGARWATEHVLERVGEHALRLVERVVDGGNVLLDGLGRFLDLILVGSDGLLEGVGDLFLKLLVRRLRGVSELPDCPSHGAPHLGQLLRPEDEETEEQDNHQFRATYSEHENILCVSTFDSLQTRYFTTCEPGRMCPSTSVGKR